MNRLKLRSRIEAVLAGLSALLAALTLLVPDWFERLLGASPDGGDGSAERWFAVLWVALSIGLVVLSRRDARRAVAAEATG